MALALPPASTLTTFAVLAPLVLWRLYARFKRMVGRQTYSPARPWFTLVLFPLIIALLIPASLAHPASLAILGAGIVAGVALGNFGLRKTRFEHTTAGWFYTPNAHLGIALTLLFVARMAYRALQVTSLPRGAAPDMGTFTRSPVTLAIFGLLAGYYVTYAIGLLRWHRATRAQAPLPDSP